MNVKQLAVAAAICMSGTQVMAQCNIDIDIQQLNDTVCSGTTLNLTTTVGTTGVTYSWTGPNSFTATTDNISIPNITSAYSGTFRVTGSKTGCPNYTDTVNILVITRPATPTVTTNAPICIGDTLKISALNPGGVTSEVWGPAAFSDTGFSWAIDNAGKINTGIYKVLFTDSFNCQSDTARYNIPSYRINTRPDTPVATSAAVLCAGDTLKLLGTGAQPTETYNWYGPNQQYYNTQDVISPNYTLQGKQIFLLTVDSLGCHSVPDTVEIDVRPKAAPKVSISASPAFFVGLYTPVILTANTTDTGLNIGYQWRKDGKDILGAAGKTHNVVVGTDVQAGEIITVWLITGPTCSAKDTALSLPVSFTINTGISTVEEKALQIYPNPVKDVLTVTASKSIEQLVVTSISGTVVPMGGNILINGTKATINTGALTPGLYLLRCGADVTRFVKTE